VALEMRRSLPQKQRSSTGAQEDGASESLLAHRGTDADVS